METKILSTGGLARRLGVSLTTVRRLEAAGIVQSFRLEGSDRRVFTIGDVEPIRVAMEARRGGARAEEAPTAA